MKRLTKLSLVAAVTVAGFASTASAEFITINAGGPDGNYTNVIAPQIKKGLEAKGHDVVIETSKGSVANIKASAGKKNVIGIAQADVVKDFVDNNDGYDDIGMNGNLGSECGFMVVRNDGPDDIQDLVGKKVAAGKDGSGTLFTFNKIVELNPELADIKVKTKSGKRYIGKVENNSYAGYFFMNIPDPKNAQIKDVVKNKQLEFLPLDTVDLGAYGEGDNPIYKIVNIPVKEKGWVSGPEQRVQAVCTHATIIADEESTSERVLEDLYEVAKNIRSEQQSKLGMGLEWFNKTKDAAMKKVEELR